jgi:Zn-dependent protease
MFQQGSLTLFRVRGVPIRAHWTLLLILPYLAFVFSMQFRGVARLAGVSDEALFLPPLVWGVVLAIGLFASITLHELAHTFAAVRFGGSTRSITLMLVGGVSQLARAPQRAYQEAIMAAVGPLTSLALGGLLLLAYAHASAAPADVQMGLFYLSAANLTLGVFNLVPAFPMDGGRLLRAALAVKLSRERATRIASRVGKVCAIVLGIFGLWSANILLMLVAVFVYSGAQGELLQERVRGALEGLRIVDLLPLLRRPPPVVGTNEVIATVLPRMRELDRLELIVLDPQGAPTAVLQAGDLAAISATARWSTTVGEVASQLPKRHVIVPWDASANDAIQRAGEASAEFVIVIDPRTQPPDGVVGLVAAEDISRMVKLQLLAAQPPSRASAVGPDAGQGHISLMRQS